MEIKKWRRGGVALTLIQNDDNDNDHNKDNNNK